MELEIHGSLEMTKIYRIWIDCDLTSEAMAHNYLEKVFAYLFNKYLLKVNNNEN